jgi:predicted dehydrogenase
MRLIILSATVLLVSAGAFSLATMISVGALLALPDIQMVVVGVPNDLHCQVVLDVAAAGKHVVIEKPLCLNLAEADRMIAACREAGVKLMYAEELCFAPKYVRLKQLLDSGALGKPTLLKQSV